MLKDLLGYDPKRKDQSYVNETVMSMVRLNAWMPPMVHCLVGIEERGGRLKKELAETYGRIIDIARNQLAENVREFVKP